MKHWTWMIVAALALMASPAMAEPYGTVEPGDVVDTGNGVGVVLYVLYDFPEHQDRVLVVAVGGEPVKALESDVDILN